METHNSGNFIFDSIDYTVFLIMLAISMGIGIYFGFFSKSADTTDEYLMGGRKLKPLPVAISLVASQISAISIMTMPAEVFTYGLHLLWSDVCLMLVLPIMCYIIIPVFYNNNISNCYEYLEMRFNKKTRKLITGIFILNVYLMLPIYIFVPSLAFSQVTGISIHLINGIVCAVCVFYTMLGGIKAVVWTDVVQATIMLGSVCLIIILAVIKIGGISEVLERANDGGRLYVTDFTLDLSTRATVWNSVLGGIFGWISYCGVHQSCVQRIVSLKSLNSAKKSLLMFTVGATTLLSLNCFTGIVIYARYYLCDPVKSALITKPDKLLPFFVQDVIGHLNGIPGLFISCLFSAALSTTSANLNSLAGILYFDLIKPYIRHTESRANFIMKIIVVTNGVYCILGAYVVEQFNSIFKLVNTIFGLTQGAVAGVFLLGMLYPKAHSKAAFISTIFSVVIVGLMETGNQIHTYYGDILDIKLPSSTENCNEFNITLNNSLRGSIVADQSPTKRIGLMFTVSFYWYPFIGAALVWFFALPLSTLMKREEYKDLDSKLLSPFVAKWITKKSFPEETPLAEIKQQKKINNE